MTNNGGDFAGKIQSSAGTVSFLSVEDANNHDLASGASSFTAPPGAQELLLVHVEVSNFPSGVTSFNIEFVNSAGVAGPPIPVNDSAQTIGGVARTA